MRKGIGVLALLALVAGLGGFYLTQGRFPWEPPAQAPQPPPAAPPVAAIPSTPELPAPTLTGETPETPSAPAGTALAKLEGFEHTVKSRRASDLSWEDARAGMPLYEDDAVRTFEKSSATISFGVEDKVEVDQNALVVIKPRAQAAGEGSELSLALLSADLLKSLEAKPATEQREAIAAAASRQTVTIRPVTRPGVAATPMRVAVRSLPDRSTTVAALTGSFAIVTPKGKEVVVQEKMVTKITEAGLVAAPRQLPGSPELMIPRDGETYPFLRKAPRVSMSWKPVERARGYRVVVASDAGFKKIFADERVAATAFDLRNLQPGTYYWRVRAQDGDGFEGPYSPIRSVRAVYDDLPPKLTISSPAEMFISPSPAVELRGQTERDARVRINGQKADVGADGSFHYSLTLKEGVNLVTIEAADPAGNTEYARRVITYKGAKRSTASLSGNQ